LNIKVTVNDAQLQRRLAQIRAGGTSAKRAAAETAAEVIRGELEIRAPKATGEGAESIEWTSKGKAGHADIGQQDKWYLRYHEKGTSKMPPHPFVEEAVDAVSDEAAHKAGLAYLEDVGL